MSTDGTIWEKLSHCVSQLDEPFRRSEIVGWFRHHHPDVAEQSLAAHIQGATSNAPDASRGAFLHRTPLITRIDRGLYRCFDGEPADANPLETTVNTNAARSMDADAQSEPHESEVQAHVVTHLAANGWSILRVADTRSRERGFDVEAERDGQRICVEVKGWPSKGYADPRRADEAKRTAPSAQAGTWFAQAILKAMRVRSSHPDHRNVVAFPDRKRYRDLAAEIAPSLESCRIEAWLVRDDGTVEKPRT